MFSDFDLSLLPQALVTGVVLGLVYGLVAVGFSVVYSASGFLNLAQGSFVMLGGVFTYKFAVDGGLPLVVAGACAVALVVVIGLAIERLVVRTLVRRRASPGVIGIAMLGITLFASNAVLLTVGSQAVGYPALTAGTLRFSNVAIPFQAFWQAGVALVLVMGLVGLLNRTHTGRAMRAVAYDPEMARAMGISPSRVLAFSFACGALVGACAGVLVAPQQPISYNSALPYAIKGFAAAVVGGVGSPLGAVMGGVIVGLVESLSITYIDSTYSDAIVYGLLVVFLLLKRGDTTSALGVASTEGAR